MSTNSAAAGVKPVKTAIPSWIKHPLLRVMYKYRYLYLLTMPGILYLLLFKLGPMWGLLLAFKDYNPFTRFFGSEWVDFKHFQSLFQSQEFPLMIRNTFGINFMSLFLYFPLPIVLSVLLNEVRFTGYKRVVQSIVYLPHFLSWVVISSMTFFLFSTNVGIINKILISSGSDAVSFLTNADLFWPMIVGQVMWKETGWGTIIFLATMAGIDPQLYEAAVIDGASRFRQIWHITLPGIRATIITLLILRLGQIFDTGFEQILLMQNHLVRSSALVFDVYAYTIGIREGRVSIGIAVGLFKSLVGLIFVIFANKISKKAGFDGIY